MKNILRAIWFPAVILSMWGAFDMFTDLPPEGIGWMIALFLVLGAFGYMATENIEAPHNPTEHKGR